MCAICGKRSKLTNEHLPPKKAFNDSPLLAFCMDRTLSLRSGQASWGREGSTIGRHLKRLCARCNGRTGSWYGTDYRDFVKVAAEMRIPPGLRGDLTFEGRPAAVAKEALVCICTSAGPDLTNEHEELRKLILSNKYRSRPQDFRLWVYLRAMEGGHQTGRTVIGKIHSGEVKVVAEFSHWPVGWVLSWRDQELPELCEITHWLNMEYKQRRTLTISVPRLWTLTGHPLDYRTPEQVQRDYARDTRAAAPRA